MDYIGIEIATKKGKCGRGWGDKYSLYVMSVTFASFEMMSIGG